MSAEEHKAVCRRLIEEVWNHGQLDVVDECVSADYVRNDPANPGAGAGPEGYKRLVSSYREAFPDLRLTIERQIAEGDTVATRWNLYGTHRDAFMGFAATGKHVHMTGVTISRLVDGKLVESWLDKDAQGLQRQLTLTV